MALTVNTNMASSNALNHLNNTNRSLSNSFRKISSGLRISRAGDDAAGLAVAENLSSAGGSLRQAARNTNDGISVIQTAEGATAEVGNILKRMRELAVQSSSETLADGERAYIQDEYVQAAGEVDRIAAVTNFNGVALGDGSTTSIDVQVGIDNTANDRIAITLGDLTSTTLGVDTGSVDLSTSAGAQTALTTIDTALDTVSGYRSDFGASQNRLESALNNLETYTENLSAAESQIRDADFAYETAEMAKFQIMQQAGIAVLGQANAMNQGALRLVG
ncbi:MAG: flagellin FliC [Deltaproteobacteria bacterium]|nr:flagellin FliC [Deltaproteobacteria bacterium]